MEGDGYCKFAVGAKSKFQSTPSAWRETYQRPRKYTGGRNFNPLPPHGGRHIIIIAQVEESIFQSTPSAWRETSRHVSSAVCIRISIHSLRMEGDYIGKQPVCRTEFQSTPSAWRETFRIRMTGNGISHFNPLPPHGGRPAAFWDKYNAAVFQSTPSAWRETESIPANLKVN